MRCGDRQDVAEFIKRDLLLHGIRELSVDLVAGKRPLNFYATEILHEFFLRVDQLGLLIAEIKAIPQAKTGDAVLAVESRQCHLIAEREFGKHDREIEIIRPIENTWAVREGE